MSNPDSATGDQGRREPWGNTVLVDFEDGVAWVTMNRPAKRNAMNPAMNDEMIAVLDALETDPRCRVLVLTGAGESFSAGMDLKEFFRAFDGAPHVEKMRASRAASVWQWRVLRNYYKPTIAMVNGWCFGGGFTPMIACDMALADEAAVFGVSEINWGIVPAGNVAKVLSTVMNNRKALYYIMTGETFDGRKAAKMGLVTEALPKEQLRARTIELAKTLMGKSPTALRQSKVAFKYAMDMTWDEAAEYLIAKNEQSAYIDPERSRERGMKQFLDEKAYRPGLDSFRRET
jgi:trans-feruloyl-CoA hydratase/vanillin synthase